METIDKKKQEVIELVKKYNLNLNEKNIKFQEMGLDFQVVFATDEDGQRWILRMPRREDVTQKIEQERNVLDSIREQQDVFGVPHWEIVTDKLIAYKEVTGKPAVTFDATTYEEDWVFDKEKVPMNYTQSLAKALATLHQLDFSQVAGIEKIEADELKANMKERMENIRKKFDIADSLWGRWQKWLKEEDLWPEQVGVIHGDLFPGHTLINEENRVTGMIDWTEAKISDVATDFTSFYLLFGEEALDTLIQEYAKQGGYTWPRMKDHIKEHVNIQALTIAEFAMASGSEKYKDMADSMLKPTD